MEALANFHHELADGQRRIRPFPPQQQPYLAEAIAFREGLVLADLVVLEVCGDLAQTDRDEFIDRICTLAVPPIKSLARFGEQKIYIVERAPFLSFVGQRSHTYFSHIRFLLYRGNNKYLIRGVSSH
ncbi:MAG: hypothetical protein JWN90_260 [Parcubacteria group bacterium]|nr:hypothetical protein [Parcubacteria group bacterium]